MQSTHADQTEDPSNPSIAFDSDGDITVYEYQCSICNETARTEDQITNHQSTKHSIDDYQSYTERQPINEVPRGDTLEALYVINKHAKKYANQGTERYRNGQKAAAKRNSVRKDALYSVKSRVIEHIYEHTEDIRLHEMRSSLFFLFDFGNVSFHSPIDTVAIDADPYRDTTTPLDDFHKEENKEYTSLSLKEALTFFETAFDINANDHLSQTHVTYGYRSSFVGWKYLGEE